MSQKYKLPIRQSQASARAEADFPPVPAAPDEIPFVRIEWTPTEQARIAEILAKEPAEPTPELIRVLTDHHR
jgi:hypothetical protein